MRCATLSLLTLAACAGEPADKPFTAVALSPADCDPTVTIPTGLIVGEPPAASPHAEVYGAEPTPYHLHMSWPSRDTSRNAAFLWRTDVDTTASLIEWGPAGTFPEGATRTEGASYLFGGAALGEGPNRVHEARLCGALSPDTDYSYRVGGDGGWSPIYTFHTPPAPGTPWSFRVAIAGDSRGAYTTWSTVLSAMQGHAPDLYLFTGDMVELGANQREWDEWFDASGEVFATAPLMASHGNHEFLAQQYFVQFAFPGNEEWFDFEVGDTLFLSLNDTVREPAEADVVQADFIRSSLEQTELPRRVAMHHQALYSTCTNHGSNDDLRARWAPALEDGGVSLVLAGHNHIYERSAPVRGDEVVSPEDGTLYLVSGGAGAPLYTDSEPAWFGAVAQAVEHYIIADFSPEGVDFVVYDLSGTVIDRFSTPR